MCARGERERDSAATVHRRRLEAAWREVVPDAMVMMSAQEEEQLERQHEVAFVFPETELCRVQAVWLDTV